MNRPSAVQAFSLLAIIAGALVSYYPPPSNAVAIWSLISMFLGYGVRDLFGIQQEPPVTTALAPQPRQAGFVRPGLLLILVFAAAALSACGAMNTYTGAALNAGEANYTGAKQNIKSADDMKLIMWADSACALPLGALARNATGNPYAINAALVACPIPNVGIVQAKDGVVQVQITPTPTPTPPYTPSATKP
jgi:hypothetical protein